MDESQRDINALNDLSEEFARLYTSNQQTLYRYAISLVMRHEDAMDILQEASVAILRKMGSYQRDKPFLPWARRFVYLEVLRYRKSKARSIAMFDTEVLEQISLDAEQIEPLLEHRRTALRGCMTKLTPKQQELLQIRYSEDTNIHEVAEASGRSVHTLYDQLKRLRSALMECIDRQLRKDGLA
ncbi:MAG: sigma-70 family RNA polymerase sigma factor [Phycisphaeraceae bacterium]|nr:sigma-70 family RNA polymerase sigma factor [Phycisphaeraceae bacterium]